MGRRAVTLVVALLLLGSFAAAPARGEAKPAAKQEKARVKNPIVTIQTSLGTIRAELFADKAPVTVENFLEYARSGFYAGTVFHRVIPHFMIQGGGLTAELRPKPTRPPIKNEAANGLKNLKGTLAMARTSDVDSATSQFFINTVDNPFLDHRSNTPRGYGYAVFGKVIDGMDVVAKIERVKTANHGMHQDVPVEPVTIEGVTVEGGGS